MGHSVEIPAIEFLRQPRPASGDGCLALEAGVRVVVEQLDLSLAQALRRRFGLFAGEGDARAPCDLRVRVACEGRSYFIEPPARPELNPLHLACEATLVRVMGYRLAGWFDTASGEGGVVLARGDYEPAERALENYLRAAVAFLAAERGGALVHAASAVWEGAGYLFYGASGAGKSTLAALDRRARVVSDDLSLVLPARDGRPELVGTPFRGTYEGGPPVVGRFPLRAGFRLVQAPRHAVEAVPRVVAFAQLVGNLPFVADALPARGTLLARLEHLFREVPLARLCFHRGDDGYWDAIAAAGYGP